MLPNILTLFSMTCDLTYFDFKKRKNIGGHNMSWKKKFFEYFFE